MSDDREPTPSYDQIEATIQKDWGAVTTAETPIDATIAPAVVPAAMRKQDVVVSQRRVREAGDEGLADAEYELVSVLGQGGMGVVYQARQASIGRAVAVKMLRAGTDGQPGSQEKFIEEAAVTGELDHPNIVPIYDLGRTDEGLLFYAMKQVRGTPWKEVLRSRTVTENLRVLMRVADAVAFAHSRGIVHRDLKPENIMLGEFGEVLVMDWGLAIFVTEGGNASTSMGGTPCYMAPEMVKGPPSAIGAHSDVYLLGAILHEIVTGSPPHYGADASQCLLAAARNKITPAGPADELSEIALRCMATRPADRFDSVKSFQEAIGTYESHLASIAASARARDDLGQAQEAQNYDAFARALFGFQNAIDLWSENNSAQSGLAATRHAYAEAALAKGDFELGLSVLDATTEQFAGLRQQLLDAQVERDARQQRLRSVRRTAATLAAGLVIVMSVALVWIVRAERRTREQRDIARVQQQLARAAVDQMLTEVGQQQLEDVPNMELVRRNLLNKALGFYLRFLDEQPDDPSVRDETAQAYHRVGDISKMLGLHQEADQAYTKAITLLVELAGEFPDKPVYKQRMARSQNFLGELYRTLGNSEQAEQQYKAALRQQQSLADAAPGQPEYLQESARTSYNLGLLYWATDRPEDARRAYGRAIDQLGSLAESPGRNVENRQGLARAYLNRGLLNRGTDRTGEARQDYDLAIGLLKELTLQAPKNAEYRYELALVYNNLGNLLLPDTDQRAEAEQFYNDGLELLESLANDFPGVLSYRKELANSVNSLAALSYFNQDFEAAERLWRRSRGLADDLIQDQPQVPGNHSLLGRTLGNLGSLSFKQGNYAAARSLLEEAIASQQAALEKNQDHPEFRTFLRNYTWSLTETHLALKDHQSAALTAQQLPQILPDDPAELYRAAALVSRCIPLADEANADPSLHEQYATLSIGLLNRSLDAGFSDPQQLDADPAFDSVRDLKPFQKLRQRLPAVGEPADR